MNNLELKLETAYADIITSNQGRYAKLSREVHGEYKKNFQNVDQDKDSHLNLQELGKLFEVIDKAKTAIELKKILAAYDGNRDGKLSFHEYVDLMMNNGELPSKPAEIVVESIKETAKPVSKKTSMAAAFEAKIAEAASEASATDKARAAISGKAAERKHVSDTKALEAEREQKEALEKAKQSAEAKARIAEKASMFNK